MRRRVFLSLLAGSISVTGCVSSGENRDGNSGCDPETWDELLVKARVEEIRRNDTTGRWNLTLKVTSSMSYADSGTGIDGAEIVALGNASTVIGTADLGSLSWQHVPDSRRDTFQVDCGGGTYNSGSYVRTENLTADTLPKLIAIRWKSASADVVQTWGSTLSTSPSNESAVSASLYTVQRIQDLSIREARMSVETKTESTGDSNATVSRPGDPSP